MKPEGEYFILPPLGETKLIFRCAGDMTKRDMRVGAIKITYLKNIKNKEWRFSIKTSIWEPFTHM